MAHFLLLQIVRILHRLVKGIDWLAGIAAQRIHWKIPGYKHILAADQVKGQRIVLFPFHNFLTSSLLSAASGLTFPKKQLHFFAFLV
jgi:hypothetical protein